MGNGEQGKNGKAQEERGEANGRDRQSLSPRKPPEDPLDARKPGGAEPGPGKCHRDGNRSKASFYHQQRRAASRSSGQEHIGSILCHNVAKAPRN